MTTRQLAIVETIHHQPESAIELRERIRCRWAVKTVAIALAAGHKAGVLSRIWDGNGRYGRYLYFCKPREGKP